MLLQAINGNGNAISQLATTLNCDINAVQSAINSVQSQIQFKIAKRFLCDDCRQKLVIEIKEIDKKD